MVVLYVLFALAILCPVYTYILYPCFLSVLRDKNYRCDYIEPSVSVIVVGDDAEDKIKSVQQCDYPKLEVRNGTYNDADKAAGEIVIFTDTKTQLDLEAVRNIVSSFADERVACVVGQQTNPEGNSAFWKYENIVKGYESRIGCVSGATEGLFAVRKEALPKVPVSVRNKPFFIATKITENGMAVVFQDEAKTYEGKTSGINFKKHVSDAAGYWQALRLFPRMLIGHHGSFVYVSHRVLKWFVWVNMLVMLVASGILGLNGAFLMALVFWLQVVTYFVVMLLGRMKIRGPVGKLLGIGYYFVMLNVAYFVGAFKVKSV